MALRVEHEIHRRRFSRNLGVGLALAGFGALIFALSVAKFTTSGPVQGYDYSVRPELVVPSQ